MSTGHPSYWAALRHRHAARSFLPSILGRASLAMSGLALVLLLESDGSFAAGGAVTATLGVANVVATPWRARAIDRFGQTAILSALGALHTAALLALAAKPAVSVGILLGVVAGVSIPPFGSTMRAVWSSALADGPLRTRGLSLDAVAEELIFAVGPLASAVLATLADPALALCTSAGCVAAGTGFFVLSPLSRHQRGHRMPVGREAPSPLRSPGFLPVVVAITAPGLILGAVEIAAPALGAAEGSAMLPGVVLALFAGTSAVGGLVYGRLSVAAPVERQLLALSAAMIVTSAAAGLIGTTPTLVAGIGLAGGFIAPLLITGYVAADARTDPRVRTEASSWINTAINLGAAAGSGLLGAATEFTTPGGALALCAAVAAIVVLVSASKRRRATR